VTFGGNAKILGGLGNDSLFLGIEPLSGDANTKAMFNGALNVVDGGAGLDFFDPASGQFTGVTPVNWT
jgi:hypothetical protein